MRGPEHDHGEQRHRRSYDQGAHNRYRDERFALHNDDGDANRERDRAYDMQPALHLRERAGPGGRNKPVI